MKHTPGPWKWSANRPMVRGAEGHLLGPDKQRVLAARGEPTIFVTAADARLIAAAPELLAALFEIIEAGADGDLCGFIAREVIEKQNLGPELGLATSVDTPATKY